MSEDSITWEIENLTRAQHVVITGGEPTIHNLDPLIHHLMDRGFRVHLETNGTRPDAIPLEPVWVTVSPKPGFNYTILIGDELKVVFDGVVNPEQYRRLGRLRFEDGRCFIQPCSGNIEPALQFVKENPSWRLSLQTHKLINIA